MNTIGGGQGQFPTSSSPYVSTGKAPVGLEPAENKRSALPPIEESAAAAKTRADQLPAKTPATGAKPDQQGSPQSPAASAELDGAAVAQVRELAAVAREVQAHEAAHAAAGGALAGAKSFSYVTGPDGVRYAVAGEVSIEFGQSADDPELTLRNASQVRVAALAPVNPSPQDLQVAAQATQIMQQAQQDLANLRAAFQAGVASRNRSATAMRAFGLVQREQSDTPPLLDQRV